MKQASKAELNEKVPRLLGAQNLPLHNLFLRGIYSTASSKNQQQQQQQGVPLARVASGGAMGPGGPGPGSQQQGMGDRAREPPVSPCRSNSSNS